MESLNFKLSELSYFNPPLSSRTLHIKAPSIVSWTVGKVDQKFIPQLKSSPTFLGNFDLQGPFLPREYLNEKVSVSSYENLKSLYTKFYKSQFKSIQIHYESETISPILAAKKDSSHKVLTLEQLISGNKEDLGLGAKALTLLIDINSLSSTYFPLLSENSTGLAPDELIGTFQKLKEVDIRHIVLFNFSQSYSSTENLSIKTLQQITKMNIELIYKKLEEFIIPCQ